MKIEISGEAGEGKTTVSAIIEKALREAGYNVEIAEGDLPTMPMTRALREEIARGRREVQEDVHRATTEKGRPVRVFVHNDNRRVFNRRPDRVQTQLPLELRSLERPGDLVQADEGPQPVQRADQDCG
jgi:CO dehydrogenase nickel-insertion accessory protein CooC1